MANTKNTNSVTIVLFLHNITGGTNTINIRISTKLSESLNKINVTMMFALFVLD